MQTYISLLRGINVSGQKKIKMQDLKGLYESLGFENIRTYIQSGNVVFRSEDKENYIIDSLQNKILIEWGYVVAVMLRDVEEMKKIIGANPYLNSLNQDLNKYYVIFLDKAPEKENVEKLNMADFAPEEYVLIHKEIYLHVPLGYGNAKLNNNFFENKFKIKATTRNWKTTNELLRIAEEISV